MEVKPLPRVLRLWPWLAAICSGLLYTGCFAPFNFTWLCWVALTPLIAAIWFSESGSRHRWLRNLLLGYVAGLTFFWTAFAWLTTVTVPGWFVLAFYMAIYFAIWAWFCGLLQPREKRRESRSTKWDRMLAQARSGAAPSQSPWIKSTNNLLLAFLVAGAWVTQEWFRGWVFSGFGWNGLGVALHGNWPLIQIAEFTGVAGLSFMVAFANVIAVTTVRRLVLEVSTRTVRPHFDLTLTLATIVGVLTFGLRATPGFSAYKTAPGCCRAIECAPKSKVRPAVYTQDFRSIQTPERNCAALDSSAGFIDLAGKLHARTRSFRPGKLSIRDGSCGIGRERHPFGHDRRRKR